MSVRPVLRAASLMFAGWLVVHVLSLAAAGLQPDRPPGDLKVPGVIDRIVDQEHAVILVGETGWELVVQASRLPPGAREGDWVLLRFDSGESVSIQYDPDQTLAARDRIQEKLGALKTRGCAQLCP